MLDPTTASRLQFALTTIVHIIFPVMSMGLAPFLVYFTWKEIRTGEDIYEQLRRFWVRIFAVSFVVGTVTGLVLEFEFGTNFAAFAATTGELFGGPLAVEGMMAFFLEATFLGIFVFGRERVSDRLYLLSSILVGLGTWLSAVWILVANSWMQTPRGFEVMTKNGHRVIKLVDPVAAYLNPRFPWMFVHMQNASVLSVALFMAGVAAYYIRSGRSDDERFWRATLKIALVALLITAPLQVIHGDAYARHVSITQPQKFAAMEAVWKTASYVPEYIVAFPTSFGDLLNPRAKDIFGIGIPGGASWLVSAGNAQARITGLDRVPRVAAGRRGLLVVPSDGGAGILVHRPRAVGRTPLACGRTVRRRQTPPSARLVVTARLLRGRSRMGRHRSRPPTVGRAGRDEDECWRLAGTHRRGGDAHAPRVRRRVLGAVGRVRLRRPTHHPGRGTRGTTDAPRDAGNRGDGG